MARNQAAVAGCDRDLFVLYAQADDNFERCNVGEIDLVAGLADGGEIDARIIAMRAHTPAGIARKVKEVLDVMNTQEDEPDCWYRRMLRSVLADLVEMERRAAT